MFVLTMSMPTPRPLTSSALVARRQAGQEDQAEELFARQLVRAVFRNASHGDGLGEHRLLVDAAAVVLDLDHDVVALLVGVQRDRARGRLADFGAALRRLDAVIDGVADHVHERIAELFDDQLVDLGLGAGDDEADLLVASRG